MIEVDEGEATVAQVAEQAGGVQQILDIAPMARSFADDHLGGAESEKRVGGRGHHRRMGIDGRVRLELHHVRLEQHSKALHGWRELGQASIHHRCERVSILICGKETDR